MNPLNVSFLQELLETVGERGRALIPSSLFARESGAGLTVLVDALVSGRGEASGVAIADQLLEEYARASQAQREEFFFYLARTLTPDREALRAAASAYLDAQDGEALNQLRKAAESPRLEFFRRLNLAPGATSQIVSMRHDLLILAKEHPDLRPVDADLKRLFYSWFNRGFLVVKRIDWHTPAAILEKIIEYEAVHEISGWDDLRRRLDPADRRCFAFFHPALVDEPLIFVEVALMADIPSAIEPVLREPKKDAAEGEPTTAVFYSISNCQDGLKGITFGNFLVKQVVEELKRDLPTLKTFVTLSPVPRFARWLDEVRQSDPVGILTDADRAQLARLSAPDWSNSTDDDLKTTIMALATHYFLRAKANDGKPYDPVARFHLGNGARLERINWLGDRSEKGLRQAHALMVNYLYDIREIEKNHEAFANEGEVVASRAVRAGLRSGAKEWSPPVSGAKAAVAPKAADLGAES